MSSVLQALKHELRLYASVKIFGKNYLVTRGDLIHLPFNMRQAAVGDRLKLSAIETVGSRNYTWNGNVDASKCVVEAVVVEKTRAPLTVKETTKRRNRHVKHTINKPAYTTLRVSELKLVE